MMVKAVNILDTDAARNRVLLVMGRSFWPGFSAKYRWPAKWV